MSNPRTVIRRSGYRVYITGKEVPLLEDLLSNDVFYSEGDCKKEEKSKLVSKLLGTNDQTSPNLRSKQ